MNAHQVAPAAFDALDSPAAVLSPRGEIRLLNAAWRHVALSNGRAPESDLGANYLAVCDAVSDDDALIAGAAASGLREVLDGDAEQFSLRYPCAPRGRLGAALLQAHALSGRAGAVVSHTLLPSAGAEPNGSPACADFLNESDRSDAFLLVELSGRIIYASRGLDVWAGTEPEGLVGVAVASLVRASDRGLVRAALASAPATAQERPLRQRWQLGEQSRQDAPIVASALLNAVPWGDASAIAIRLEFGPGARPRGGLYALDLLPDGRCHDRYADDQIRSLAGVRATGRCQQVSCPRRDWEAEISTLDRDVVGTALRRLSAGEPVCIRYRIVLASGAVRWIRDAAWVVHGRAGTAHVFGDVSEIDVESGEAAYPELALQALETVDHAMVAYEIHPGSPPRVRDARSLARLLRTRGPLIDASAAWMRAVLPADHERFREQLARIGRGETSDVVYSILAHDGSRRRIWSRTRHATREGCEQLVFAVLIDVTDLEPTTGLATPLRPATSTALTNRQRVILQQLSEGLTTEQISERLVLSEATIRGHIAAISARLDVHSRVAAVAAGHRLGLIQLPD